MTSLNYLQVFFPLYSRSHFPFPKYHNIQLPEQSHHRQLYILNFNHQFLILLFFNFSTLRRNENFNGKKVWKTFWWIQGNSFTSTRHSFSPRWNPVYVMRMYRDSRSCIDNVLGKFQWKSKEENFNMINVFSLIKMKKFQENEKTVYAEKVKIPFSLTDLLTTTLVEMRGRTDYGEDGHKLRIISRRLNFLSNNRHYSSLSWE